MRLTGIWQRLHHSSPFGAKTLLTGTTNVIIGVLGIFSGAFVARLLGPKGRGELAAIQTWPTLFGYLVMLGTDQAVVYYSAREPDRAGRFVGTAASISVLVSI